MRAADFLERLADKNAPVLNLLAESRVEENRAAWKEGPQLSRRFARLLLKQGHPTLALEVAARSLDEVYPDDHELLYCRAFALARCGNPTKARLFAEGLLKLELSPAMRTEALSLAGRIRKDLAARTADPAVRVRRLREAYEYYRQAYELSDDTFPGINAATLALLAGERDLSRTLAARVRDQAQEQLEKPNGQRDAWGLATLGEACLLLDDQTAAKGRYGQAVRLSREAHADGDIESMHRQLRLLSPHLPIDRDLLALFRIGPVVVFAGHSLDRPGDPPRFPADPALEALVRKAIRNELEALETTIGYYSPACGSDILFGELMHDRTAETHMVLPFAEEDFIPDRLTYGLDEFIPWQQRYEELRGFLRVTRHFATAEPFLDDHVLYDFAGSFIQGLALIRAAQIGTSAIALVVQDPAVRPTPSGVATFVESWKRTGQELRVINLAELRSRGIPPQVVTRSTTDEQTAVAQQNGQPPIVCAANPGRTIKSMLFADVAGFSGLKESHLPTFFIDFLSIVEDELKTTRTLLQNTWGDGLYIVFDDVVTAADFALRLLKRLETFDYSAFNLKEDKQPGIRIALHTGPVFEGYDAIIGRTNYFGSHVSRAARIEPVTMPGSTFVSEQFAAALALEPNHDFFCEYLGLLPLAKGYDVCHLYRLTTRLDHTMT